MMIRPILIILLALAGGCGAEEEVDYVFLENPNNPDDCYYEIAHSEQHRFVDAHGRPYDMQVDYEVAEDADNLSAYEVGGLAAQAMFIHEFMALDNHDATYDILSNGHWVVAKDNHFVDIYEESSSKDVKKVSGVIFIGPRSGFPCYSTDGDENWTSMVRRGAWNRDGPSLVVHEMMHAFSQATYGDSDGKHENVEVWSKYGSDTVQDKVLYLHDLGVYFF